MNFLTWICNQSQLLIFGCSTAYAMENPARKDKNMSFSPSL